MLRQSRDRVMADPGLSSFLVDPATGDILQEGQRFLLPALGRTLQRIARGGAAEFYLGQTARQLVAEVRDAGGVITLEVGYHSGWLAGRLAGWLAIWLAD